MIIGVTPEIINGDQTTLMLKFHSINTIGAPVYLPGDQDIWTNPVGHRIDPSFLRQMFHEYLGVAAADFNGEQLAPEALTNSSNPAVSIVAGTLCPPSLLQLTSVLFNEGEAFAFVKTAQDAWMKMFVSGITFTFTDGEDIAKGEPTPENSLTFFPYYGGGGIYPGFIGGRGGLSSGGGASGEWHPPNDSQWHPDIYWQLPTGKPGNACSIKLVTDGGFNVYYGSPWTQWVHASCLEFVVEANSELIFNYGEPFGAGWRWQSTNTPAPYNVVSAVYNGIRYAGHHIERSGEFPTEEYPLTRTTTYQETFTPATIWALGICHSPIIPSTRDEEPIYGPPPSPLPKIIIPAREKVNEMISKQGIGTIWLPYDLMWHGQKLTFLGEQITHGAPEDDTPPTGEGW